jgi:N6-L-threonylcarbamoyladenine synthase
VLPAVIDDGNATERSIRVAERPLTLLGIETSCDETAVAVVRAPVEGGAVVGPGEILSNVVYGQEALHADFGGVVPEIAARAHVERLPPCLDEALARAGCALADLDGVAATGGPGLIGGVLSGVTLAKGLSFATGLPFLPVNHLEGHALTPRLTDGVAFPYLLLLVSGGHCQLLSIEGLGQYRRLGGTIDDAPGEAFDKIARHLGLGFPGGPALERAAEGGDAARFALPRPLLDRPGCDMSFSGLKTAMRKAVDDLVAARGGLTPGDLADLCASFQRAIADVLAAKTARALAAAPAPVLAVAGGVAANRAIRLGLEAAARAAGARFVAPPVPLCTDNGAMIAWAGAERLARGERGGLDFVARPRWPLDETAPPMLGAGRRGAKA